MHSLWLVRLTHAEVLSLMVIGAAAASKRHFLLIGIVVVILSAPTFAASGEIVDPCDWTMAVLSSRIPPWGASSLQLGIDKRDWWKTTMLASGLLWQQ